MAWRLVLLQIKQVPDYARNLILPEFGLLVCY